ncbi:MAG: DUF131 domain-containing protein [Candidatus Undinarchaeales archaeon]
MKQDIILIGFILVIIGMAVILIGSLFSSDGESKVAVGGFIGPIPFGFANDPKMLKLVYGIMIGMVAVFFALPFILRYLGK